jgi:hypothetical protein
LDVLPSWKERVQKIDQRLKQTSVALATRNEKLLGLCGDFDALTTDFWKAFGRGLGCEDPTRTIAFQRERMRSIGHISCILVTIAVTVMAAAGAWTIPELAVFIGTAGVVALCAIVGAPLRQISRAQEVTIILGREQEPFWLTAGSIALSNLSVTPPQEANWWWKERVVFVFVRQVAVRCSLDAFTGEPVWEDPCPHAANGFSASGAARIVKDLLNSNPRYLQMVNSFQNLASLESNLTFLRDLKAEAEQVLAAELREARREVTEASPGWPGTSRPNS